jgi:hypothetical protein
MLPFKIAIAAYIAMHVCAAGAILYLHAVQIINPDLEVLRSVFDFPMAGLIVCNGLMVANLTCMMLRVVAFLDQNNIDFH